MYRKLPEPRASNSNGGGVALEDGIDPEVATELHSKERTVRESRPMGGYQAIEIDWERGIQWSGTDPRKNDTLAAW